MQNEKMELLVKREDVKYILKQSKKKKISKDEYILKLIEKSKASGD